MSYVYHLPKISIFHSNRIKLFKGTIAVEFKQHNYKFTGKKYHI